MPPRRARQTKKKPAEAEVVPETHPSQEMPVETPQSTQEDSPVQSPAQSSDEATEVEGASQPIPRKEPATKPVSSEDDASQLQASPPLPTMTKKGKGKGKGKGKKKATPPASDEETTPSEGGESSRSEKPKRREKLALTNTVEEELSDWLRNQPIMYDKGHPDYLNSKKKDRIWEEKAATLDPPLSGSELKRWYNSMRTAFGRLVNKPSGSGATGRTARQNFQLTTFAWLRNFMTARKERGRQGGPSLKKVTRSSQEPSEEEEEDSQEPDDEDSVIMAAMTPMPPLEETPSTSRPMSAQSHLSAGKSTTSTRKRKRSPGPTPSVVSGTATSMLGQMMGKLENMASHFRAVQGEGPPLSAKATMRKKFIESTTYDILECSDDDWKVFKSELFWACQHIHNRPSTSQQPGTSQPQQQFPGRQFPAPQSHFSHQQPAPQPQFQPPPPQPQYHQPPPPQPQPQYQPPPPQPQPQPQYQPPPPQPQYQSQGYSQQSSIPSQLYMPTLSSQQSEQPSSQTSSPWKLPPAYSQPSTPMMPSLSPAIPSADPALTFHPMSPYSWSPMTSAMSSPAPSTSAATSAPPHPAVTDATSATSTGK